MMPNSIEGITNSSSVNFIRFLVKLVRLQHCCVKLWVDELQEKFRLEESSVGILLHHVLDSFLGLIEGFSIRLIGTNLIQYRQSCLRVQINLFAFILIISIKDYLIANIYLNYLIGSLNGYKVVVDLLSFGNHLLRFAFPIIFNGHPEIQIFVTEFA